MISTNLAILLSIFNFGLWFWMGHRNLAATTDCQESNSRRGMPVQVMRQAPVSVWCDEEEKTYTGAGILHQSTSSPAAHDYCHEKVNHTTESLRGAFEFVRNEVLDSYKENHLAHIRLPEYSTIINLRYEEQPACSGYVNPYPTQKGGENCLAVVSVSNVPSSSNMHRFKYNKMPGWTAPLKKKGKSKEEIQTDAREKKEWALLPKRPTGFFGAVAMDKDRFHQGAKMLPFLESLQEIEATVAKVLRTRGFHPRVGGGGTNHGPDASDEYRGKSGVVVMTVNDGEMDMISNFVCSCRRHNIPTDNFLVFAGSKDILTSLEAMGVMAVYHEDFAKVSKKASAQYLDKTFVDMMWYKAFSVWLLLRMGLHVLFQDVDLVWFKEPFSYFMDYMNTTRTRVSVGASDSYPDAFFSDDGARSARYAPFFANSGFYLLRANPRTEYFAWTIISAYDTLHQSGSHQNVFTYRLTESLDLFRLSPKLLDINQFPTGVKYHRDHPFMIGIKEGWERPYNFHMCWTLNKENKIEYFKNVNMWYISGACENHEALRSPQGAVYKKIKSGQAFARLCCSGTGI
jgi:hypothetical protein